MGLLAAIIGALFLRIDGVFGSDQTSCPNSIEVKTVANVGKEIKMTTCEDLKEVEVSIPQNYLEEKGLDRPIWQVKVELVQARQRLTLSNESNKTLLNVLIRQGQDTVSFQFPRSHIATRDKDEDFDSSMTRNITICPGPKITAASTLMINLVSTSLTPITVKVFATLVEEGGGWITKNQGGEKSTETRIEFSFSNPLIRTVRLDDILPDQDNYVILRIESEENSLCFCSLLSVQKPRCPYFDSIADAKRFGRWQTMADNTSMLVDVNEFKEGEKKELLIVLIGAEDEVCNFVKKERNRTCSRRKSTNGELRKNMTITLEPIASAGDLWKAISILGGCYLGILIVCLVMSGYRFEVQQERFASERKKQEIRNEGEASGVEGFSDNHVEEGPKRVMTKKYLDKRTVRLANIKASKQRYKKNQLYMGGLFIISLFYGVTVLQTAFYAQRKQYESGNNDICYYNTRCQNPLIYTTGYASHFLDFNHVFSNIGYVVFGLTFIRIVHMQSKKYIELGDSREELLSNHGIPYITGVYYSMGGALMMQGLMSAAYHICPTPISYQYDTTFMYLIAILTYVKLYQNRHPDSSASAVKTYVVLGFAIVLEAISIYFGNSCSFWAIFCTIYILSIVCVVANIYQLDSRDKLDQLESTPRTKGMDKVMLFKVYRLLFKESVNAITGKRARQGKKTRPLLVFIFITCLINVAMCVYFGVMASLEHVTSKEVGNILLFLFMANTFIYLGYYVKMKYKNNERLHWKTICYAGEFLSFFSYTCSVAVFSAIFMAPALYFYTSTTKNNWVSPAESRELNRPCQILNFYDT